MSDIALKPEYVYSDTTFKKMKPELPLWKDALSSASALKIWRISEKKVLMQ